MNESQQALAVPDLDKLNFSLSSFLSKQQGPTSNRSTPDAQAQQSGGPQAASAPASKATDQAADKAADKAALAKKGKGVAEPAVPLLQTVPGQVAELSRWSSMLQTNSGIVLQDNNLADWLADLLRMHAGS